MQRFLGGNVIHIQFKRIDAGFLRSRNDVAGAKILTANDTVMVDADNFGLALVGVPYKAEILDETHIRIVGHQGALIIAFQPPENNEGDWLITSITPQGAVAP